MVTPSAIWLNVSQDRADQDPGSPAPPPRDPGSCARSPARPSSGDLREQIGSPPQTDDGLSGWSVTDASRTFDEPVEPRMAPGPTGRRITTPLPGTFSSRGEHPSGIDRPAGSGWRSLRSPTGAAKR